MAHQKESDLHRVTQGVHKGAATYLRGRLVVNKAATTDARSLPWSGKGAAKDAQLPVDSATSAVQPKGRQ